MDGHGGDHGHGHDGHDHGGFGHDKGFGHAVFDLNFGHGHHAGAATFDAIVVGHAFGDFDGHSHGVHIDSHVDTHSGFHAAEGSMEGNGPSFDGPMDINRINMAILVVGLGQLDWETAIRDQLRKLGAAECLNLQPPNPLLTPARRYDEVLPVNFKNPPLKVVNPEMPKGYYPGAGGSTTIWRTNWQVGERSGLGKLLGHAATRKTGVRTYLEVEVTHWAYTEVGDNELRLVVRVVGGKDRTEIIEHITVARGLCQAMLKTLKGTPPSSDARRWRETNR